MQPASKVKMETKLDQKLDGYFLGNVSKLLDRIIHCFLWGEVCILYSQGRASEAS